MPREEVQRESRTGKIPSYGSSDEVKPTLRRRRRGGFTLIELLMVIGIITILASLLLPALSEVRKRAKQTLCAGNLKQLGLVMMTYCDNYNAWLPGGRTGGGEYWYNDLVKADLVEHSKSWGSAWPPQSIEKASVVHCPSVGEGFTPPQMITYAQGVPDVGYYFTAYGTAYHVLGYGSGRHRVTQFKSTTLCLSDAPICNSYPWHGSTNITYGQYWHASNRHEGRRTNILHIDGHVLGKAPSEITIDEAPNSAP